MITRLVGPAIVRELRALRRELEAYSDERDIWATPPGITNSAGTLTLHAVGNLRHFIGAKLGGRGYLRDRTAEFADRDVPRSELLELIDRAAVEVKAALERVGHETVHAPYPQAIGGVRVETRDFLLHLATHLAYHLGQVDYHRRMVTGDAAGVGAMAVAELGTAEMAE